jgi:DNA polymerase-1
VYGFTSILLNVVRELKPSHLIVSFDVGKTWRHEAFEAYKAHREKMPDELREQEEKVFEVVRALNMPIKVKEGFEADDVLGTLAQKASELRTNGEFAQVESIIVTGDMDILQLVHDESVDRSGIKVYKPGGGRFDSIMFDEAGVKGKYQLTPAQIIEYKALAGDSSDNIPGIKGIGKKTATKLLHEMDTVEGIYEEIDSGILHHRDILKGALLQKLMDGRESAFESKKLVTIVTDVPLEFNLDEALIKEYDKEEVIRLFEEYEFRSLIGKLPQDEFEEAVQEALF